MHLPEDLLLDVLLRLPAESLVRFKCVSKAWQAIIDSPNFMREYLPLKYYSSSAHRCLHLIRRIHSYIQDCSITLSCDDDDEMIELNEFHGLSMSICGPINGIYCIIFQGRRPYRIIFWNPAYGKFHVLPPIPPPAMLGPLVDRQRGYHLLWHEDIRYLEDFFSGFMFDPMSKDYRVLCMSEYGDKYRSDHLVCFHEYSLASNSWQELHHSQIAYPPDLFTFHEDGRSRNENKWMITAREKLAFPFNGWCHWIYFRVDREGFFVQMLSSEMARRVFRQTSIPREVISAVEAVGFDGKFMTVDGSLAVAFLRKDGFISDTEMSIRDASAIGIAVMKEYGVEESWEIAYNIELNSPGNLVGIIDDRVFVHETENEWVVSYRVGAHQEEYEDHCCVHFKDFVILPFQGSLIPPYPS